MKKLVVDVIGSEVLIKSPTQRMQHAKSLSEEEKSQVIEFYCRDDISRQAPGIKDVVIIRKKGEKKETIQKRFMMMTVGEAFSEFKRFVPQAKVGKSTFYSLRPDHVKLISDTPHDVCICKYHYNFISLLESLHKAIPTIPQHHRELIDQLSCKSPNEMCMLGQCSKCPSTLNEFVPPDMNLSKQLFWKQWEDDNSGRPILRENTGTCQHALECLSKQLDKFKKHCYVKKIQSDCFQKYKGEIVEGEVVMQMDFAENYAIVSQDEIQSAHWSHSQVTLFTCCVWFPDKQCLSYVVVSNDMSHSKYSVYTFIKALIEDVRSVYPQINKTFIFSDNCAQQFKNKYTLSNLCFFEKDFNLEVEWNFFASSHGKGAMDGIGGTVKRNVWTAVKSRKVLIDNAKQLHQYVDQTFNTKIKSLYIDKEDVNKNIPLLNKRWDEVIPIPGIQSCHHFRPYDDRDLLISKTEASLMKRVPIFKLSLNEQLGVKRRLKFNEVYTDSELSDDEPSNHPKETSIAVDIKEKDFVVVVYEGEYFPGQINEVKLENDLSLYKVQCMQKSGPNWKWPSPPDELFYSRQDILKKMECNSVIPVSNRGVFKVVEPLLESKWKNIE